MGSKRKIKKSIKSYQKRIDEHLQKIKEYSGKKDFLVGYWEKEIKGFQRKKKEQEEKLGR